MIKLAFAVFLSAAAAGANCPTVEARGSFNIKQKVFAFGADFDVLVPTRNAASGSTVNQRKGKIVQRMFSWTKTFQLYNGQNQLVATAKQRAFSFGSKVDIMDCQNRVIGSVQENVMQSFFKVHTVYSILDANNALVGQSKKQEWLTTEIRFYGNDNREIASLVRPYFNWLGDTWTLTVTQPEKADLRMIMFAAAYKTSVDDDRAAESDDDDE